MAGLTRRRGGARRGAPPALRQAAVRRRRPLLGLPTRKTVAALLLASLAALTRADAGHEMPYYPSYYPQEIRIEAVAPAAAATLLPKAALHAYIGAEPAFGETVPEKVGFVKSLGSYLVLTFDPASRLMRGSHARCATASTMLRAFARMKGDFVFQPYPITPYHMDYLKHFDLARAAKAESARAGPRAVIPSALRVRARGPLAERLVRPRWRMAEGAGDVTVEEIDASDLVLTHSVSLNGWLGPPWVKEGWFQAYLLLGGNLAGRAARGAVEAILRRLFRGEYEGQEEEANLERKLVSRLTRGCERVVVGYTVKREYFNSDYYEGVENIAYDSLAGFNAPIFLRTVKLKDFPWNGWLRLGVNGKPSAAWNPIGGFTDPAGRLIWFAVGDPALFPDPYGASQTPNRIADLQSKLR